MEMSEQKTNAAGAAAAAGAAGAGAAAGSNTLTSGNAAASDPANAHAELPQFSKNEKKEFNVRCHIHEARELQPREDSGISDPVCYVTVNGAKQHTEVKKKTLNCTWDHCFFWTLKMNQSEFENCKVQIDVFDANTIRRNVLIGATSVDLSYVFKQDRREVHKQWAVLTDTTGEFEGVQGYLQFSVAVSPEGEALPPPRTEEDDDDSVDFKDLDLQSLVLSGPQIPLQEYLLNVKIWKAEGLPKTDRNGLADPFVEIKFGGRRHKTQVCKKTLTPVWNENIMLPCSLPSLSDRIEIIVYDWDTVGNDLICANYFSFKQILDRGWGPGWLNMYGVPGGDCSEKADPYNRGFVEGTAWRGRFYLQLTAHPAYKPKLSTKHLPAIKPPHEEPYVMQVDLYEGSEIVESNSQITVEFEIGSASLPAVKSKKSASRGSARFYKQIEGIINIPHDINWNVPEVAPDLIVNVYTRTWTGGKQRAGYLRLELVDLYGFSNEPKWYTLKADEYGRKYEESELPGALLMNINFGKQSECPEARDPMVPLEIVKYELRCHLYQGRNLPAADANGLSDPYVTVRIGGEQAKGKVETETVNPTYYTTLKLKVSLPTPLSMAPPVTVMCYDYDRASADDLMGRFTFPIEQATADMPAMPQWFPLYMDDPDVTEGELLCSFQIIPYDLAKKIPIPESIEPRRVDCYFEINAIGLRDMVPYNLMDISNPQVEFDIGGKDSRVVTTPGKAKVEGRSAALLETLHTSVRLPVKETFAPMINVRVFDDRALGRVLVGSASIPIAPYLPWAKESAKAERLARIMPQGQQAIEEAKRKEQEEAEAKAKAAAEEEEKKRANPDRDDVGTAMVRIDIDADDDDPNKVLMGDGEEKKHQHEGFDSDDDDLADYLPVQEQELTMDGDEDSKAESESEESEDEPIEPELPKAPPLPAELEMAIADDIPFEFFELYLGQSRGLNYFEQMLAKDKKTGNRRVTGTLKARFRVIENAKLMYAEDPIDLRKLYRPKQYVVRVYILKGHQLTPQDSNGFSDPYVIVSTGQHTTTKKEGGLVEKTNDPEFFKCFEMRAQIPGDPLKITVMDHDALDPDDEIGSTVIDLENRFFSPKWQEMDPKPIEFRTLWTDVSKSPQGKLEMFVEILSKSDAKRTPPRVIAPPPPKEFELRVIIWETKDCVLKDGDKSDIFVSCMLDDMDRSDRQETDSHWNSKDGSGSFNWRMKFPVVLPKTSSRLKIALWDKDLLSANDQLCEAIINLKRFWKQSYKSGKGFIMDEKWIKMYHPAVPNVVQGQVKVTIELLPIAEANARENGFGRSEPNKYPKLDPPDRPDDSFAPWNVAGWAKLGGMKMFGFGKKVFYIGLGFAVLIVVLKLSGALPF
eukprot:TRINITY_DN66795_c5_g1_i1.p1 TRINITY_DN66795_c5_g1~~TRINITY_DN66795_c5_g1_i1.p1  ORF type:complete len:1371 (-),score=823.25 TRINITY_DN66795_c5_g1_i1:1409-5521(-)